LSDERRPTSEGGSKETRETDPGPTTTASPRRFRISLIYLFLLVLVVFTISKVLDPGGKEASYDEFLLHLRLGHVKTVITSDDYHRGFMEIPRGWYERWREGRSEAGGQAEGGAAGGGAPGAEPAKDTGDERKAFGDDFKVGGKLPKEGPVRFVVAAVRDPTHDLTKELEEANRKFGTKFEHSPKQEWSLFFVFVGLPLLFLVFWYFMMRQSGQMGRTALSFGKIKARLYDEKIPKATFEDVAGCVEAKEELKEVVDYLRSPKKYQTLGGKMPKGVLLVGPPGCGKTLLARAVAGEAKTPFFHLSGSDFVEMFVGVGAARVRDLFQQAKNRAPSIVFVDELDAVGRHRGAGLGGGHDEREQTLNQLLVEMDGFDTAQGVIMLAATNRPDVLDPALLRPGRFDRQVVIDAPDAKGRRAILEVHAQNKKFAEGVDFSDLAAKTPGFTGADLANVINEAALLAARRELTQIGQEELDESVERVIAGPERKSRRLNDEERRRVAYHEAGHALVAALSENADPVRKISIVPRGHAALGYTMQSPADDRYLVTQNALIDKLKVFLAGRAAEQLVFGEVSTGAGDDLKRATQTARTMVCRFGMSDKLGPVTFGREQHEVFLGRDFTQEDRNYSEETARKIDNEVRRIIEEANGEAERLLEGHRECLEHIAETLLKQEVIQGAELEEMLRRELGEDKRPRKEKEPAERKSPSRSGASTSG
jgi:cell division protease FtsH